MRLTPDGLEPIEGVVDDVSPSFLGVRSDDAIYWSIYGFDGTTMVGHQRTPRPDQQQRVEAAWSSWLTRVFGGDGKGSG